MRTRTTQLFVDRRISTLLSKHTRHKVIMWNYCEDIHHGHVPFCPHRSESSQLINRNKILLVWQSSSQSESLETNPNDSKEIMYAFIDEINKILVWLVEWMLLCPSRDQVHQVYASPSFIVTTSEILRDKRQHGRKALVLKRVWGTMFSSPREMTFQQSQQGFLFLSVVLYFDLQSL